MGWEVKALARPVSKSFFSFQNIRAIFSTRRLLKEERFDVISSHATLAGIVTRLAVMMTGKLRKDMKVFHTAHGYLFHDDKSLKKWAYLIPEMICSKVTDVLMVMNHEDLSIAKKYKLCRDPEKLYYINGMGIDLAKFQRIQGASSTTISEWKKSFGLNENDFAFVYAAEFSKRKNHPLLLKGFARALDLLKKTERFDAGSFKLVLAGDGALLEEAKALAAKLGIEGHVLFPGYVRNIPELYACCQAAVTTSRIEGLPFNVMEAMACGLPVIASDIKGHRELITHGENGLLFESGNHEELADRIIEIYQNAPFRMRLIDKSPNRICLFSIENVKPGIIEIYLTSLRT
jgi:glycosyltransferase EpsD